MSGTPSPEFLRTAERMAQSAATPDFADLRSRALKTIHRALGDHARPLGYRATRSGWEKPVLSGTARVRIQRGGGGAACAINLDFVPRLGKPWPTPVRLGQFYRPEEHDGIEPGWILYLDVAELPDALDLPMQVFSRRALPWLEACRERGTRGPLDPFIPARVEPRNATGVDP